MIGSLFLNFCNETNRVESSAYDAMLQSLLSHSTRQISVDSLRKIEKNVLLLDAREPNEYDVSHMEGAINVGYKNFNSTSIDSINKDTTVVVYCSVGYRSEKIAEDLQTMGFENVLNLYGGIFEWKNSGLPLITESGPTDKIHAYSKGWGVWLSKGEKVYN